MNNDQLKVWLDERGLSVEAVNAVVQMADQIKELYRESTEIGAAMDHEDFLEEISTTGRGSDLDEVVWFLLGLCGAPIAFLESME